MVSCAVDGESCVGTHFEDAPVDHGMIWGKRPQVLTLLMPAICCTTRLVLPSPGGCCVYSEATIQSNPLVSQEPHVDLSQETPANQQLPSRSYDTLTPAQVLGISTWAPVSAPPPPRSDRCCSWEAPEYQFGRRWLASLAYLSAS